MNRYREMKVAHQDEMNDFLSKYAIFAFSPEQFEEQKKKHVSEPGGYVHIGYGCNLLKSRVHEFEALAARHKKEIAEALADPETGAGFAYDMFRHELENHEFSYTLEEDETLEALDIDRAELIRNAMLREALKKAKQDILQEARREDEAPMMRVLVIDPEEGAPREEMTPGSLEELCRLCKCDNIDIAVRKVGGREYDFIMDDDGPFNMGARVSAPDLRAGAALVIAGLAAEGITVVDDIEYIQRGYENFEGKLRSLGAIIERVSSEKEIQKFRMRVG